MAELITTSYDRALKLATEEYGLPTLNKTNYIFCQALFKKYGITQRKQMPRIRAKNVLLFKGRLEKGYIDIKEPFSPTTDRTNIFRLTKDFLINGLRDNDLNDDKVNVILTKNKLASLKPTQEQIYLDTVFDILRNKTLAYLKTTIFLTSNDGFILDGHHRFVSMLLFYPNTSVQNMKIDLKLNALLPLSITYTKAIGNTFNESSLSQILNKKIMEYIILLIKNYLLAHNYKIVDLNKFLNEKIIKNLIEHINDFNINVKDSIQHNIKIVSTIMNALNIDLIFLEKKNLIIPLQYTIKNNL